jgi:hypothetical protein
MADNPDVTEILRRTVQANARFYKGWVDLSLEYWRGIGEIFGVAPTPGFTEAAEEADEGGGGGLLVLEAETGATARGAFLVTNDLGRNVRCELVASELSGPRGAKLRTPVTFDPANLELAPGQQSVVTATVPVEDRLIPGAAYTGTVSIRGMDGFSVPFVLRRTHTLHEAERAAQRPAAEAAAADSATASRPAQPERTPPAKQKRGAQKAQPRKRRGKAKE